MGSRLYVGNLPFDIGENDIEDLFTQAGKVASVDLIQDRNTGKARGFGFVQMGNDEEAKKAIEMFHGKELGGRALMVNEARPREERSGGGFRGGRDGGRFQGRDRE